jgi:hypothetical protein
MFSPFGNFITSSIFGDGLFISPNQRARFGDHLGELLNQVCALVDLYCEHKFLSIQLHQIEILERILTLFQNPLRWRQSFNNEIYPK